MTKKEFLLLLDDSMELEPGTLVGTENLDEIKWDSLSVVVFLALIEEQFEILMEPEEVDGCENIQDLIDLLDGRVSE